MEICVWGISLARSSERLYGVPVAAELAVQHTEVEECHGFLGVKFHRGYQSVYSPRDVILEEKAVGGMGQGLGCQTQSWIRAVNLRQLSNGDVKSCVSIADVAGNVIDGLHCRQLPAVGELVQAELNDLGDGRTVNQQAVAQIDIRLLPIDNAIAGVA